MQNDQERASTEAEKGGIRTPWRRLAGKRAFGAIALGLAMIAVLAVRLAKRPTGPEPEVLDMNRLLGRMAAGAQEFVARGPPDLLVHFRPPYRVVITGPALDKEVIRVTSREQLQEALTRLPTEGSYTLFYPTEARAMGEQPKAAQEVEDVLRSHGLKSGGLPAKADMKRLFQISKEPR